MSQYIKKNFRQNFFAPPLPFVDPSWVDRSVRAFAVPPVSLFRTDAKIIGPPVVSPTPPPYWVDRSIRAFAQPPEDLFRTANRLEGWNHIDPVQDVHRERITGIWQHAQTPVIPGQTWIGRAKPDPVAPPEPEPPYRWFQRKIHVESELPPHTMITAFSRLIPAPTFTGIGPEPENLDGILFDIVGIEPKYKITTKRNSPRYSASDGIE